MTSTGNNSFNIINNNNKNNNNENINYTRVILSLRLCDMFLCRNFALFT